MGGSGLANPNEPQGSGGVFSAPYTLLNDHRNIIGIIEILQAAVCFYDHLVIPQ